MRVEVVTFGEKISPEEFEEYREPDKKVNVMEIFFKIGHIENGYACYKDYVNKFKIPFKTPFKAAPVFLTMFEHVVSMTVYTDAAYITLEPGYLITGCIPYLAIGFDVTADKYDLERDLKSIRTEIERLKGEIDFKAGLAAGGGALGGFILDKIIR